MRLKLSSFLLSPTDQMRRMPSSRVNVEGRANVRIVDSTSRTPLCCRSAPITSQNHCHITANTVMFLSKTKVRTFNVKYMFF